MSARVTRASRATLACWHNGHAMLLASNCCRMTLSFTHWRREKNKIRKVG